MQVQDKETGFDKNWRQEDLIIRISELEAQNLVLIAENRRLREALGLPLECKNEEIAGRVSNDKVQVDNDKVQADDESLLACNDAIEVSIPLINKYSSPEEKITLFMSLFRGRDDVYAKRCYSQKHNSSYYIPACKNE